MKLEALEAKKTRVQYANNVMKAESVCEFGTQWSEQITFYLPSYFAIYFVLETFIILLIYQL